MNTYIVKIPTEGKPTKELFDPNDSYNQLSKAVGGYLETAPIPGIKHRGRYSIDCFVDEEGLLKHLPLNIRLSAYGQQYLVGDAVFVAHDDEGESVGLTEEDANLIMDIFA